MDAFEKFNWDVGSITCHFGLDFLYGREEHEIALNAVKRFVSICNGYRPETEQIIGAKDDLIAPLAHEVAALAGADHFLTWASVGMAGGMCVEASNYPEDKNLYEVIYGPSAATTSGPGSGLSPELQEVYDSLPDFCKEWPFNDENPWNFANMLPFEAGSW